MKRNRMLYRAITWLAIIGGVLLAYGITIWFGSGGNKANAIWLSLVGIIFLATGLAPHLLKVVREIGADESKPTAADTARVRAYLRLSNQRIYSKEGHIAITLRNIGGSLAKDVKGHMTYQWYEDGRGLPAYFSFRDRSGGESSVMTLVSAQEQIMYFPIDGDLVSDAVAGKRSLFAYGHVDYVDIFNNPQYCTFCYKVAPITDGKGRLDVWGTHNACT